MATPRLRLGQLLVDARMLSDQVLDEVLAIQRTDGRRLGMLLVEHGYINETQLTQILSHQLAVPWVSLLHIEFSRQLLNLVPREVAERYCLVPIYVRHVRNQGETLYVAMDDPTNEDGLKECNLYSGLPVRAMIAPPSDIRSAIRVYYGANMRSAAPAAITEPPMTEPDLQAMAPELQGSHAGSLEELVQEVSANASRATEPELPEIAVEELDVNSRPTLLGGEGEDEDEEEGMRPTLEAVPSEELLLAAAFESRAPATPSPPTEPSVTGLKPAAASGGVPAPVAALLGAVLGQEPAAAAEEERQSEPQLPRIPSPRRGGRRMLSLTLLDGTTISLPTGAKRGRPAPEPEPPPSEPEAPSSEAIEESGLTARDLVAALRAVSQGADASEVLGPNVRWEAMFAALLSLLLKKHLIADWEFIDELKKI